MNTQRLFLYLMVLIASCVITSCALQPPVPDSVIAGKYADEPADGVLRKVQTEFSQAESAGLGFFAPEQFRRGKDALRTAANLRADKSDEKEILKYLYLAEQQLALCRQIKSSAQQQIPEVLSALESLKNKNIERAYASDFELALWNAGKLLHHIEEAELDQAGSDSAAAQGFKAEKQKLLQYLRELDIKVVKFNTLNDSQMVFKEVEKLGGKSLAPKTYAQAENALEAAKKTIEQNVHNEDTVTAAGRSYEFAVFHALHVTRAVSTLQSLSRAGYEDYILDLENKLQPIAQIFKYRDIRNHALQEQIQLIASLAKRSQAQKTEAGTAADNPGIADTPELTELKSKYKNALEKIQELNGQINQWQNNSPPAKKVLSTDEKKAKQKASALEARLSELLLEYNNLKAERDSLQNKLNEVVGKN